MTQVRPPPTARKTCRPVAISRPGWAAITPILLGGSVASVPKRQPQPDIAALIRDSRRADSEALERLLSLYRNYLRLLAGNWLSLELRGKADPSDLVQETLMEAHQDFAAFEGDNEEAFVAWLRQILARNVADLVRRFRSAARDIEREDPPGEPPLAVRLARFGNSLQATPSQSAQRRELGVVLADALAELAPDQRQVILLRNLQERPWREIAAELGRSEEAARKLWTRALINLKPLLEDRL